jgi:predicted RNase H-like HicB family nuclease
VTCPLLLGLVTQGDTLEEALEMAKEGYLESVEKGSLSILEG